MKRHVVVARRLPELFRFSAAGLASLLLDLGVLVALKSVTPMPLAWDAGLAFAVAALGNFALTRQWVFTTEASGGKPSRELARYGVLVAAGLALTTAAVPLVTTTGIDYRVAKLVAAGLVAALNYLILPLWVFRPASTSSRLIAEREPDQA
jgi:putative flippase GtrA